MPKELGWIALTCLPLLAGCGLFQGDKTAQLQVEKQQLVSRVQMEMQQRQQLEAANRELNTRLAEAEKAVARLAIGQGGGLAPNLQTLASNTTGLSYDASTHLARFDSEIIFAPGQTQLDDSSRRFLDQVVGLLNTPSAQGSRIVIAGQSDLELGAARAASVATYLRQRGVQDQNFGGMALEAATTDRSGGGRVALLLAEPNAPIIGQLGGGVIR